MNLILFEEEETRRPLALSDARARHLLTVLRRRPGDSFDAGLVDGPRGRGTVVAVGSEALDLAFSWGEPPPPLAPITLLLGLPRPQTARKILGEATALGVSALHFVPTEKGEPSYAQSSLWSTGEWRRHLVAGAEQAFCTRLPHVTWADTLPERLAALPAGGSRVALDNYEAPEGLGAAAIEPPVVLALGPERGWSAVERDLLRSTGFRFHHLGTRVLRAETAVVASVALVLARLGRL